MTRGGLRYIKKLEWDDDDLQFLRVVYRQLNDVALTLDVYKLSWLKRMKNETP